MESFHIIVLTIAVIILILVLTVIGIMMTNKTYDSSVFPPSTNSCPDYWTAGTNGNCTVLSVNKGSFTTSGGTDTYDFTLPGKTPGYSAGIVNFNDNGWTSNGGTALCNQKDWAIKYGISWDGVANYNGCK
jgi:hypothetical protein